MMELYDEFIPPAIDNCDFNRSKLEKHLSAPFSSVSSVILHLQESIMMMIISFLYSDVPQNLFRCASKQVLCCLKQMQNEFIGQV